MVQKILLLLLLQLFLVFPFFGQTPNQYGTTILKTIDGYLIVDNKQNISYRIEFKGKSMLPLESDHPVFDIDGKLIQVVTVANSKFYKSKIGETSKPTEDELLEKHQVWESDYIAGEMNSKLTINKQSIELNSKKKGLLWTFDIPKSFDSQFTSQIFLTTVIGESVLGLNSYLEEKDSAPERKKYLVDSINTLQMSLIPFDVVKISEELKKVN